MGGFCQCRRWFFRRSPPKHVSEELGRRESGGWLKGQRGGGATLDALVHAASHQGSGREQDREHTNPYKQRRKTQRTDTHTATGLYPFEYLAFDTNFTASDLTTVPLSWRLNSRDSTFPPSLDCISAFHFPTGLVHTIKIRPRHLIRKVDTLRRF